MKKIFVYHLDWSLATIAFFSLIVSFFVFVNILQANTGGGGLTQADWRKINGWAWSPNIGWLSLNCLNDFNGDGDLNDPGDDTCSIPYGLHIDTSASQDIRAVGGCAWAGNVGWWICFDDPLLAGNTQAPDYGVYLNNYYWPSDLPSGLNPGASLVPNSLFHGATWATQDSNGHASILPLEGVLGWSNELGFPIVATTTPALEGCFNCTETKTCSDDGSICTQDSECTAPATCVTNRNCDNCLQYNYDTTEPPVMQSVVAGYDCSDCTFTSGIETICTENAYERNKNSCTTCANYYDTPGLLADYTLKNGYGSACGWAWNQDSDSGNGVGWIQFGPRITAGNNPYFQVNSGDIYARKEIRNYYPPVNSNTYNAFVIETNSNTIYNLYASSTLNLLNRPLVGFPALGATGKYTNILGSIDYDGLITEVGETGKNKYGSVIDKFSDSPMSSEWHAIYDFNSSPAQVILDNKVYYYDNPGMLMDSGDLEFGANASKNGSGVIVVNGSAIINKNITYTGDDKVSTLKNIPSVVWVIKGGLDISPDVTELSGTFIVLGAFNAGGGANQLKVNG
ncbi:MAG: hypothetical protein UR94_C0047G0001, partial [Parcubacteria group bacterium GW2011_GWA2_36_10]